MPLPSGSLTASANSCEKIAVMVLVGVTALTVIVMALWNWLVPPVIGWKTIDFWQALGLLVLTRILFGFRAGFGYRMHWRGRMAERWLIEPRDDQRRR